MIGGKRRKSHWRVNLPLATSAAVSVHQVQQKKKKNLAVQEGPEWLAGTRKVAGNTFVNGAPKNDLKNGRGAVLTCWPRTCLTSLADKQPFASQDAKTGLLWKNKGSKASKCLLPSKIQAIKNNE